MRCDGKSFVEKRKTVAGSAAIPDLALAHSGTDTTGVRTRLRYAQTLRSPVQSTSDIDTGAARSRNSPN
jgi:hypothetical protein